MKELRKDDVAAETLSKKRLVDCVQSWGWSLNALSTLQRYVAWTLEVYTKSAYSEGPDTGRQFISIENELLTREEDLRRLLLHKLLRALPRGARIPRGYQIATKPARPVGTPHENKSRILKYIPQ